ncbi:DJ-1/PfpI family protein [candidate division KSB1 bacterium]|nr:DJ-1/PfpI family protein [candidate division KSB1 bacterium]
MRKVLLLLANGFEILEGAAFADVFGWADTYGSEKIQLVTASLHPEIRATFGFKVIPEVILTPAFNVLQFDALAIPGGFEIADYYTDAFSDRFIEIIREFQAMGKPIASVCVGALPIAKSGVLMNQPATTYHLMDGKRRQQLGALGARVVDAAIVQSGNIITSTSPATAIEVALRLLTMLTTPENAARIRELMGFSKT